MSEHNKAERRPTRSEYKAVWSALSDTHDRAKMHVIGTTEETALVGTGTETMKILQEMAGIKPDDTVLEIVCGVGRVGKHLAPLCQRWIGCDVSANMLAFAAGRLLGLSNVELKEVSGYNLQGIADESIDLVYCTVVFMHLQS